MPGMLHDVYMLKYKVVVFLGLCFDQSFFTAYCHALNTIENLVINVAIECRCDVDACD